jgi:hypothetical protein
MIGIKRAAQGARDEFRKAARELQSAVADADETVTRIQMRSDDPKTQPMIHPPRRFSDQRH